MGAAHWEHFHHEADIGVRGVGATLAEAFEQTALAMVAVITDPLRIRPLEDVSFECDAPDPELLLVDWLNAVIFQMATRRLVLRDFRVTIEGSVLRGTARGEPVEQDRHQPAVEIKGATYTELSVAQDPDGNWRAQCVVDV
jgi:tRNA nucleotidyltransferase (CCA-adding enzyme)